MSWRSQLKTDSPARLLEVIRHKAERDRVVRIARPAFWTRDAFVHFLDLHAGRDAWTYTLEMRRGVDVAILRVRPGW